jgi:5-methylcytosine-specific restriction endonuclease McrA
MKAKYKTIHDKIVELCKCAITFSQVEINLGLSSPSGGLRKYIKTCKIPMPNYLGIAASNLLSQKGRKKISVNDLCEDSLIATGVIKNFLLKEGMKTPACEKCGWKEMREDGKIPIELHHLNGDNSDNRLCNLQILCPNCHSLTPSYGGKNKLSKLRRTKQEERAVYYYEPKYNCKTCGKLGYGIYCSIQCSHIAQRKVMNRPTKEELADKINKYSWTAIGRMYGVSDKAVKKWAKQYELVL